MRYEVRCCCQPQKLLGWIDGISKGAAAVTLCVVSLRGFHMELSSIKKVTLPIEQISLPVVNLLGGVDYIHYPAVKAEGLTVEELKQFAGFEPNESGAV